MEELFFRRLGECGGAHPKHVPWGVSDTGPRIKKGAAILR